VPWGVYGVTKLFRSRYRGFLCSSFRQGLPESRLQGCRPVNIVSDCYRVHSFFRAHPARGLLSLACVRESNQREHTPDAALPAAVREVRPGFVERPSLCVQRTRAHRARDSASISDLSSPRQTGTEDHEPDQERGLEGIASARRSALPWLLRVPIALRRQRSETPAGAARGIAQIPLSAQGCAVNGTRLLTRTWRAGCAPGAMLWGAFLCLLSLCKQRK